MRTKEQKVALFTKLLSQFTLTIVINIIRLVINQTLLYYCEAGLQSILMFRNIIKPFFLKLFEK